MDERRNNSKRFFIASVTALLCAVAVNITVGIMSIPQQLYLLAGRENEITLSVPFSGALTEAEAVNAYDIPANDHITITINDAEPTAVNASSALDMTVALFGFPVRNVNLDILPDTEVVPCGKTVGVRINTDGVMVLGTGAVDADGGTVRPSDSKLRSGDLIIEANKTAIENKQQFIQAVEDSGGKEVSVVVKRDKETVTVQITPVKSVIDGKFKIGAWIRDDTQGIGTLTYYNPSTNTFGALGHGIMDVDTKKLMTVKSGKLMESAITAVKKGKKGSPGELEGDISSNTDIGVIKANTPLGLYGYMSRLPAGVADEKMSIALKNEIHEGPASIRSNIAGEEVKEYDIYIESINRFNQDDSKGMVIRITDQDLLTKTNGIVQGMSGSPIIQDGKLIGAVTHVFVQNPAKGYGIFIENMVRQEKKM